MGRVVLWANETLHDLRAQIQPDMCIDDGVYAGESGVTFAYDDILVAVGNGPLKHLQQHKLVPRNLKLSTLRKRQLKFADATLLLMHDPEDYRSDYKLKVETLCDIKDLQRYKQYGYMCKPFPEFAWVDNFDEVFADFKMLQEQGQPCILAMDTETVGGSPFNNDASIICISFAWAPDKARAIYTYKSGLNAYVKDALTELFNNPNIKVRFANGKYDLQWIKKCWGIECTNFNFDTLLGGNLVNENRSNSLSLHARVYTPYSNYDLPFNAQFDKTKMDEVPLDELLKYACGDALCCYLASLKITEELKQLHSTIRNYKTSYGTVDQYWNRIHSTPLQLYVKLLHPVARVFEDIEYNGTLVDVQYQNELSVTLQTEIDAAQSEGLAFIPEEIKIANEDNLSLTRAKLLTDYLYSEKGLHLPVTVRTATGRVSTAMNTLLDVIEDAPDHVKPFATAVRKFSKLSKTKSTFVDGFMQYICDDGKFHPVYFLHKGADDWGEGGTYTTRASTTRPSFHVLPKATADAKRLRKAYTSPEGYSIVQFDMGQLELRLSAYFSNDATMLNAYRNNVDLHSLMGSRIGRITIEEMYALEVQQYSALRQSGKQGNLGFLYGAGPTTFQRQTKIQHGKIITLDEAKFMYTTFHNTYSGLRTFEREMIKFARKYQFVINPFGYMARLPFISSNDVVLKRKTEQKVVNRIIQSTGSQLLMLALYLIRKQLPTVLLFGSVHDSGILYCKTEELPIVIPKVKCIVENLPLKEMFGFDIYEYIRLPCDVEFGNSLGTLQPWKG